MRKKIFLSLFFIPIVILGIELGIWQSERSVWKETILQEYHTQLSQTPSLLPTTVIRLKGDKNSIIGNNTELFKPFELMPITLTGKFLPDLIYYRPADEGIELITAFQTTDGIIAVNAGKMPYTAKDISVDTLLPNTDITITGFYRIAELYGDKTPNNKAFVAKIPYAAYYYMFNDKALSGAIHIDDTTQISDYLKGRSKEYFIKNIPNNHTQYMYTWFMLAGIAFVTYIILLKNMNLQNTQRPKT